MKKRIWSLVMLVALMASLAGCQSKDYDSYREAMERTAQLERYEEHWRLEIATEYDLASVEDTETRRELEDLTHFVIEMVEKRDLGEGLIQAEAHVEYGSLGFDGDYLVNGEGSYLTLPFIESYIRLDESEANGLDTGEFNLIVEEETLLMIQQIWLDVITDDEVFRGDEILVDTPDGKVKTTKYTITISDAVFKELLSEVAPVLLADERFIETLSEQEMPEEVDLMKWVEGLASMTLERFQQEIYVDIDGYVVREDLMAKVSSTDEFFQGASFEMHSELYSINENLVFDFPEIDEEDTLSLDEFMDSSQWQSYREAQ